MVYASWGSSVFFVEIPGPAMSGLSSRWGAFLKLGLLPACTMEAKAKEYLWDCLRELGSYI